MTLSQSLFDDVGWKVRGDFVPEESKGRGPFFPRIKQAVAMIPMLVRLLLFCLGEWCAGRGVFIDLFFQMKHNHHTGVPLGGMGCGSVGTDFRGAFNKFSIIPGIKEQAVQNIKANQFILTVKDAAGNTVYQTLLTCADFKSGSPSTWISRIGSKNMRYRGLFPRAWREFTIPEIGLVVLQEQMSPVIPNDYEDSSLPVSLFHFSVINQSNLDYSVSLTFTFRNGTGNPKWEKEGQCRAISVNGERSSGMVLEHTVRGMDVSYGVTAMKTDGCDITMTSFDPTGDGGDIWHELEDNGKLRAPSVPASSNQLAVAVCQSVVCPSSSTSDVTFCLSWHMPEVKFGLGKRTYKRRYTRFVNSALEMSERAFERKEEWNRKIEEWQNPIIHNKILPEWYRSALFNELYYVVDGSTSWFEFDEEWTKEEKEMGEHTKDWMKQYGRFAYMESWEYYMYNTYDVHFYASWALLKNWPALEMSTQLDFCDQIYRESNIPHTSMCEGNKMITKVYGKTPHDLGHPLGEPWVETNAYLLHDTAGWRDLNLKFIPLCWRDWTRVYRDSVDEQKALSCLRMMFDRSRFIVDKALADWDVDGDGVIENSGTADQTYDLWTMTGTSAYCGSLWLCAIWCLVEMSRELKDDIMTEKYERLLQKATEAYEGKLWNGRYFKFDESVRNSRMVMADQLCGVWFQSMLEGKGADIIGNRKVNSALKTIFELNVNSFDGGRLGPVNGIREDGSLDTASLQSEEVWTGTAYGLASFMIMKGMRSEGFATAEGMFSSCWDRFGLQYQTPEAIYKKKYYRAIGYMRPLSIWAMQEAIETTQL